METLSVYTIGFTKKSAEEFFRRLTRAGVKCVIDVRLNKDSQLAGFSKRNDLKYFLGAINNIPYREEPLLAPTQPLLDEYKKRRGDWAVYEKAFNALIQERQIETALKPEMLDGACLLCSEDKPHHCHRRLVLDYLQQRWGNLTIHHL